MTDFADISSWQAGADLAAYARAGHDRILIKATEGTGYTNPHLAGWWRAAGAAGLARGAYHFAKPSKSTGQAEADYFVRVLAAAGGLGPRDWVCLDVEDLAERGPKAADHAVAFAHRMVQAGYTWGVIYSYAPYLQGCGLTPVMLPEHWRWLHIANYGERVVDAAVPLPPGWDRSQVIARQYSETATQAGIPGKSDRTRVLREWLPSSAARAAEQEEDDMPTAAEVVDELEKRALAAMRRAQDLNADPPRDLKVGPEGGVWEILGRSYFKAGRLESMVGALGAALAEILGPDHPATAALAQAPRALTVADLIALAPTVPPEVAAQVIRAYAPRLAPTT